MDLISWSPLRDLDDFFSRYTQGLPGPRLTMLGDNVEWRPAATIVENDKEYTIKADLPEVQKKDIEVKVENGVLTICGERRVEKSSEDEKQHRRESFYGTFSRSFTLPDNIDHSKIAAECKDGVVKVHIPKAQSEKKSAVSIKVD